MARKETDRAFNERMVREFPGNFRIDDTVLFCIKCNCPVPSKRLSSVKAHLETKKHTDAEELREKNQGRAQTQTLLTEHQKPQTINPFNMDLCRTFLEANIPLKKITHPSVIQTTLFQVKQLCAKSTFRFFTTNASKIYEQRLEINTYGYPSTKPRIAKIVW